MALADRSAVAESGTAGDICAGVERPLVPTCALNEANTLDRVAPLRSIVLARRRANAPPVVGALLAPKNGLALDDARARTCDADKLAAAVRVALAAAAVAAADEAPPNQRSNNEGDCMPADAGDDEASSLVHRARHDTRASY